MVIANKYANAFTEVYEILQYLDKDEYKKISLDLIETIQNNRNTNYLYTIRSEKKLKEQKMPIKQIAEITGLSEKEIEALEK